MNTDTCLVPTTRQPPMAWRIMYHIGDIGEWSADARPMCRSCVGWASADSSPMSPIWYMIRLLRRDNELIFCVRNVLLLRVFSFFVWMAWPFKNEGGFVYETRSPADFGWNDRHVTVPRKQESPRWLHNWGLHRRFEASRYHRNCGNSDVQSIRLEQNANTVYHQSIVTAVFWLAETLRGYSWHPTGGEKRVRHHILLSRKITREHTMRFCSKLVSPNFDPPVGLYENTYSSRCHSHESIAQSEWPADTRNTELLHILGYQRRYGYKAVKDIKKQLIHWLR